MSKQTINVGVKAGDKSGDPLRTAFTKVNENFTELYALTGGSNAALIELAQDYAAPLFNHASHTNITVTYDDANNKILLTGAAAQVQSNWTASSGLGVILNKPTLFSGSYTDLTSKPTLFSGSYTDLTNKPTIPSAYTLPTASASILGGIKIGTGLSIDGNGVVTASSGSVSSLVNGARTVSLGSDGTLTLPAQSATLTDVNQIVSAKIYRAGASTDTGTIQTALENWMGSEQAWIDIRTEDAQINAGQNARPWAGMPSYTAYQQIMLYNPTGGQLPPPGNMAPTAKTASDNYLAYKELQRNIDIVAGNNTFSFENTGALRVPGVITKNNNLQLVSVGTTVYQGLSDQGLPVEVRNDLTASVVADGENGRVFIRTDDGTTLRSWQFDKDGLLTLPGNLTLPSNGSIQSANPNTQSKITLNPYRVLSQVRTSIVQTFAAGGSGFTSAASDGTGTITFVGLEGYVLEYFVDNLDIGTAVEDKRVQIDGAGLEYEYFSSNGTDQILLNGYPTAPPAGAVTSITLKYTRVSKIDICPDDGEFRIQSESGQDIDINAGRYLDIVAARRVTMTAGDEMRLRSGTSEPVIINTNYPGLGETPAYEWQFGADGTTLFPNAAIDGGTAPIELKSRSWSQLTYNNADMTAAPNKNHSTTFYVEGGDALLEIFRWDANSVLQHKQWTFSNDGSLSLPQGGIVTEGASPTGVGNTIALKPNGGSSTQALLIYPTAGVPEGDHIHLTADGGTTDLYLGSDNQYVKIDHGGKIVVGVTNGIPNGVSNWVGQGGWNQGYYSAIATTGGTGTGLTVNVAAGGGGYININAITIANPGSGYTAGDIITINNENNLPGTFTISVTQIPLTWRYGVTGAFTLPNEAVIGQASDVEITVAATAYTDSLTAWESVRASYQAQANNLGVTSAGWPFIAWSATGPTAAGLIDQLLTAYQIQQSPSSPPTPLIFQPPITTSAYNELRSALIVVRDSYATWQALLTSVKITSGSESVTLMSNGKLIVPGIVQTDPEENLVIRTRYAVVTSPPGIGTYSNVDFTFGTNGHLNIPIGIASDTGNSRITPKSIVPNKFFNFFVDSTDVTFTRATLAMPIAENNKTVDAQFYHNNGTIGYLWNQGTDSNVTNLNNAFNMFANGTAIKLTTQDSSQFTWTFAKDGTLTVPGSIIGTATQNVFNTTSTTVNAFGAATTLNMGAAGGTTTIAGDLVVNGTTTTINSTTLTVDDKNIELGSVASPTDTTADGGGITLKGTTDKTFTYVNSTGLWTANIGVQATSFTGLAATAVTASTASSLGYLGMPQNAKSSSANTVIGDQGKHIYITGPTTITIDGSLDYPIGATIAFINSTSTATIAITTNTMVLGGVGTTGSRSLAPYGMATAVKVTATTWYINGVGLT